jgi:predicted GNAT family N-acyltransferase
VSEQRIERGRASSLRADARAVRDAVFVAEQGIDPALEYDGHDAAALHVVGYVGDEPVATARLRSPSTDVGKVERVAVRASHRGEGWGRRVMAAVHEAARAAGHDRLRLHAQTRVRGFYESLGYEAVGDVFQEAGTPHVAMVRDL